MEPAGNPGGSRSPFSDDALREIAKEKVVWRLGVQIHALCFPLVNVMLVAINLVHDPSTLWFPFALSSWATALAIHGAVYLVYSRGVIGTTRRGLILVTVIVAMASQSLFVINYFSDFSYPWFAWPAGALLAALIVYVIVYAIFITRDAGRGQGGSWLDKRINSELERAKARAGRV